VSNLGSFSVVRLDGNPTLVPKVQLVKRSVLVVEDEGDIRELISYTLLKDGYQVASVGSGEEALALIESQPPDLVVLDLMLPGIDGVTVCRKLRANPATAHMTIVMLTAKGEEADVVAGLNAGANDYITKPFSRNVLLARVRAALRNAPDRAGQEADDLDSVIKTHNLVIHPGRHEVLVDGKPVTLGATEFRILRVLASKPGWAFTREQILDAVHGDSFAATLRAVDVQILGLRKNLGSAGRLIETVRGVGYRFKE
jgi:two-component system alkaline phosphatase synthesis response regulator PhoP